MKHTVEEKLKLFSIPSSLSRLTAWHVQGDISKSQAVFGYPDGTQGQILEELHQSLNKAGFELEHAERQDSFYRSNDITISITFYNGNIINSQNGAEKIQSAVIIW